MSIRKTMYSSKHEYTVLSTTDIYIVNTFFYYNLQHLDVTDKIVVTAVESTFLGGGMNSHLKLKIKCSALTFFTH